ncbi:MAG TPA: TlpA disulfide reductase family protein [Holophagaceae bacterium]|nr:TlpA disulfide reductase family protein [Holophagaceae bacterium]
MKVILTALLGVASLAAQGTFRNVEKPGDEACDRIVSQAGIGAGAGRGRRGASTPPAGMGDQADVKARRQLGDQLFPRGSRKPVGGFTAVDEKGRGVSLASLKGKVVLVGFWSANCEPGVKMLMDLAGLCSQRAKFNFEILAVNLDEHRPMEGIVGGWQAVQKYKARNADFLKANPIDLYLPGVGSEGPSNFVDTVWSLPLLCVVDREGNLASMTTGYRPDGVATNLKRALVERPVAAPSPTPEPAPAKPGA